MFFSTFCNCCEACCLGKAEVGRGFIPEFGVAARCKEGAFVGAAVAGVDAAATEALDAEAGGAAEAGGGVGEGDGVTAAEFDAAVAAVGAGVGAGW
jgi:hypothetical protein